MKCDHENAGHNCELLHFLLSVINDLFPLHCALLSLCLCFTVALSPLVSLISCTYDHHHPYQFDMITIDTHMVAHVCVTCLECVSVALTKLISDIPGRGFSGMVAIRGDCWILVRM